MLIFKKYKKKWQRGIRTQFKRLRASPCRACVAVVAILLLGAMAFPLPNHFQVSGVLQSMQYEVVTVQTSGYLQAVFVPSGKWVSKGEALLQIVNPDLELQLSQARAMAAESQAAYRPLVGINAADEAWVARRVEYYQKQVAQLEAAQNHLLIRADVDGVWLSAALPDWVGGWMARGARIGQIIDDRSFYFTASLSPAEASRLTSSPLRSAQVKLMGEGGVKIPVLSWSLSSVPAYQLRAEVTGDTPALLTHGRSGQIRFEFDSQPLFKQSWARLRCLAQRERPL